MVAEVVNHKIVIGEETIYLLRFICHLISIKCIKQARRIVFCSPHDSENLIGVIDL